MTADRLESTRASWNLATRSHNAHKGDQAAFFRAGGDVLFPEELELLGALAGRRVVHVQCNAGQDTLGLARRGARVTGVDLSDEAIAFATRLSAESAIPADFVCAEIVSWLAETPARFDLAFASYGAICWIPALLPWARGIARVLDPGGALVLVEFHPLGDSLDPALALRGSDYFHKGPYVEPVQDYVGESGTALGASPGAAPAVANTVPAYAYQHGLAEVLQALVDADLRLEIVREYPHSNGFRRPGLVAGGERRWVFPEGLARVPMMFGVRARVD